MFRSCCLLFSGLLTLYIIQVDGRCHNAWTVYEDSCYLFVKINESWPVAEAHCKALGADLLDIGSEQENRFVRAHLRNISGGRQDVYWLSGTDIAGDGTWVWSHTYEPISYTDWNPGQPGGTEHCLAMMGYTDFTWHDVHCNVQHYFICHYHDNIENPVVG